jgi:hypothetical protein
VLSLTPYPRCIFCGAKADSREHAIPKWMSKRLGIKIRLVGQSHNITPRRQPISFASHRARIFSKPCNAHFKHLEDAAIPLLVPMAKGRTLTLGRESRDLLALWASKTGVVLLAAQAPELREVVPTDHRRSIRDRGVPHEDTWVGYFPWRGWSIVSGGEADMRHRHGMDLPGGREAYVSVFTFAQLGFKIFGVIGTVRPGYDLGDDSAGRQFWPPRSGLMNWPSGPLVTEASMPEILGGAPLVPVDERT